MIIYDNKCEYMLTSVLNNVSKKLMKFRKITICNYKFEIEIESCFN